MSSGCWHLLQQGEGCADLWAPDLLPKLTWGVCPLDALEHQVQPAVLFTYGGISGVCQRARTSIAQARDIVLVSAEVLSLCLDFVAAEVVVDDLQGLYFFSQISIRLSLVG